MKTILMLAALAVAVSRAAAGSGDSAPAQRLMKLDAEIGAARQAHLAACSNLYALIQEALRVSDGTPGQEPANYLRIDEWAKRVEDIKVGQLPAESWRLDVIRKQTLQAFSGPSWPRPPAVAIPHAKQAPVIDGRLDEAVWAEAVVFTNSYPFNETNVAPSCSTTYRLLWDTNYLYCAFDCRDIDLVAAVEARDEPVYRNDCVEMFILPEKRLRTYWELIVSPSGSIFDALESKKPRDWGGVLDTTEDIAGLQTGVAVKGTLNDSTDRDEGYTVELAVPFNQLPGYARGGPAAGQTLSLMLVRLNRDNTLLKGADGQCTTNSVFKFYAFTPLLSWGHNLWNHAPVTLLP